MKLKGIDEFTLIKKLTRNLKEDIFVLKGVGDDAAVIKYKKGENLLLTTDILIEGVHFKIKDATPYVIGHKALACSLSDIAAMGGCPKYALVSLGLPANLTYEFVKSLYRGIAKLADDYNVKIVGGDISRSEKVIINIALLGLVKSKNLILRSKARIDDRIFVTGFLGGSQRGKHLNFKPRLKEAHILTTEYKINSMIDLSDGLASGIKRIIEASLAGAFIYEEKIPLSKGIKDTSSALYDGEDFELLFTLSAKEACRLKQKHLKPLKTKVTEIGIIVNKREGFKIIDKEGKKRPVSLKKGFKHF